jgi:hypothetical protein
LSHYSAMAGFSDFENIGTQWHDVDGRTRKRSWAGVWVMPGKRRLDAPWKRLGWWVV